MKKIKFRSLVSIVLALVMCFTMTAMSVFADDDTAGEDASDPTEVNLLVFGDSTSNGYGLSDYVRTNCGFDVNNNYLDTTWTVDAAKAAGRARISDKSYPWQLKKYIEETEGVECNLMSMALEGMRTDELRALLDPEWCEKALEQELEIIGEAGFLYEHMKFFRNALTNGGALVDGEWESTNAYLQAYTREQIEKADVIVFDCCMNNFGTYLAKRVSGYANMAAYAKYHDYYKQLAEDIEDIPAPVRAMITQLKAELRNKGILNSSNELVEVLVDSFLYCYTDFMTNFSADLELIREINPDARIIVNGVYNSFDGISLVVNGQTIDFGAIAGKGLDLANLYLKALEKNRTEYYYSDVSDGLDTFMMEMTAAETYEDIDQDLMTHYREDFIENNLGESNYAYLKAENPDVDIRINELLIEAADHTDIDLVQLLSDMGSSDFTKQMSQEIAAYLLGTSDELSESTWAMLQVNDRFILYMGVGQHPSEKGVEQKWEAVKKAYDKYSPCYETLRVVVRDIRELIVMIKNAETESDVDAVFAKIEKIRTEISMVDRKKADSERLSLLENKLETCETEAEALKAGLSGSEEQEPAKDDENGGSEALSGSQSDSKEQEPQTVFQPDNSAETVSDALPVIRGVKAKSSRKSFTVKWKKLSAKQSKAVSKIEVQYSTDKTFGSALTVTKKVSVKKNSLKVKKLKKGSTYYVRMRSVKNNNGTKRVSNWSAVKSIKVK